LTLAVSADFNWTDFTLWKTTNNGANWSGPFYVVNDPGKHFEDKQFLAIDRTGGIYDGNMYVAWARFPSPTRIMFARSTTGGTSWEDTIVVGSPLEGVVDAGQFAFPFVDAYGDVYVVWAGFSEIGGNLYYGQKMVKSIDGGQTFTDPEVIFENEIVSVAPGGIHIYNSVAMAADITDGPYRGYIYFTVPDGMWDDSGFHSDIWFMKSTNGGASWTSLRRVNDDPLGKNVYQFHQWITVNQRGAIIILFYDQRNDPPLYEKFDTYIAFSFDGGGTFTTNYRVSDVSSDPFCALAGQSITDNPPATSQPHLSSLKPQAPMAGLLGEYIGVVAYNDQIHCVWTDTRDGNQNVYYSNFGIPLLRPRLYLPLNGYDQFTAYPTFIWAACGYFDEVTYNLEISTDSTFASIDFEYGDIDTSTFTVSSPIAQVRYFWRVKAFRSTDAAESEYSDVWNFNCVSEVEDETDGREKPSEFTLQQNYPNPFNQTTKIEFTLAKSGFVSLKIYDILGREVRTLASERVSSGYKSVLWDGRNDSGYEVASGVYFYRLQVEDPASGQIGDFTETKRLVLLK